VIVVALKKVVSRCSVSRRMHIHPAGPLNYSRVIRYQRYQMRAHAVAKGLFVSTSLAIICAQGAFAQDRNDSPIAKWKLKRSCNELRLEPTALVTIRRTPFFYFGSQCESRTETEREETDFSQSHPESIPLDSITLLIREAVTRRPVKQAIQQTISTLNTDDILKSLKEDPRSLIALPLVPVVIVGAAEAMEPFRGVKTHLDSVRVLWTEDGSPRGTNFYLSRGNAESLLNHLAKLTGKTWTSVRFDNETQAAQASEVLVHFNRPVSALNVTVGPGDFRLFMCKGSDATRLVYLLSEDRKDVLTAFSSDASPLCAEKPWIIRLARAADSSWCLTELHTNLEQLQLRACQP
jgi:hypothetical protein